MSVFQKNMPVVKTESVSPKKSKQNDDNSFVVASDLQRTLADFENKKQGLIAVARMAANQLYFAGKFDETKRMCDTVLSLDPEDIETSDLKQEANYFQNNPSLFDPSKIPIIRDDDPPVGRRSGGSGLFRSVSERSRARQRFQQRCTNFTNGQKSTNGSMVVDECDDVFSVNGITVEGGESSPKRGLTRTKSESGKPISVFQKIQSFEQVARKSTGSSVNGRPPPAPRISTSSISATPNPSSKNPNDIPPQTPIIPDDSSPPVSVVQVLGTPRRHGPTSVAPKLGGIKKMESFDDSITDSPTYSLKRKVEVVWTPLAKSVPLDVQAQLEKLFFSSPLLTSSLFTSLDGEILGSTKNCKVTKSELVTLINGMQRREYFTSSKVVLAGKEYSCLSGTGHIVRARIYKEGLGVNCTIFDKYNKTMAIGFYSSPTLPKQVGQLMACIATTNIVGVGEYV